MATTGLQLVDICGQTFGRLTVEARAGADQRKEPLWRCKCICGGQTTARTSQLTLGKTTSCGCQRVESARDLMAVHGNYATPENHCWRRLRVRAKQQGLWVAEEWETFEGFLSDMGERPSPRHRLMRLDLTEGFTPENCEWRLPKGKLTRR